MTTEALSMAACEVNQILRYTDESDVNKIPLGLRLFFKDIASENYVPNINPEVSLMEQKLLPETDQILGMLYLFYWGKEDELKDVPEEVIQNAQKASEDIFKGYSEEEFLEGYSAPKNPELMRVFRDLELVEHLGTGIRKILKL